VKGATIPIIVGITHITSTWRFICDAPCWCDEGNKHRLKTVTYIIKQFFGNKFDIKVIIELDMCQRTWYITYISLFILYNNDDNMKISIHSNFHFRHDKMNLSNRHIGTNIPFSNCHSHKSNMCKIESFGSSWRNDVIKKSDVTITHQIIWLLKGISLTYKTVKSGSVSNA